MSDNMDDKTGKSPRAWGLLLLPPLRRLDGWLTRRGCSPSTKKIFYRTALTGMLAILGSIGPWEHARPLRWFGVFALFSAWNFFWLLSCVNSIISDGWQKISGLKTFLGFQMRLFLTAGIVYAALVWWNVSVTALIAGLSVALVWALAGALTTGNT